MEIAVKSSVNTSELQRALPQLLAFGRRTMREQCVTSAAMICRDAQELTPFVSVARIDSELAEEVSYKRNRLTRGQFIVLARMNPNSDYNKSTGGRWAIPRPQMRASQFKRAYDDPGMARRVFWEVVDNIAERMRRSRRSSTHFLRHGWKPAIMALVRDRDFRGRRGTSDQARINLSNTLSHSDLGMALVSHPTDDRVRVTAKNAVGEAVGASNAVLSAEHRRALIAYGTQPLQAAVEYEAAVLEQQIARNLAAGFRQDFARLQD